MPPKKANRRKKAPKRAKPAIRLPAINWNHIGNTLLLLTVLVCAYSGTAWVMDQPINAVRIVGRFERVSSMQIESAMSPFLKGGFLSTNLTLVQQAITELPWVERASVRRSWPSTLSVTVVEESAAARWGKAGLLNIYGELFVAETSHIPAELPRLSGPAGSELRVARRFFDLDKQLKQRGLTAIALSIDARGAWQLNLSNGMQVRFGAAATDERAERFFAAFDGVLGPLADKVKYIDMRYTNGFAIGWKSGEGIRMADFGETDPHV
ncbi:MAG: cell division protein FtsQ/DivIB [Gammaproteobacteria bacterium]|jgi:cell division protein FtsQ|nr:cell division protein FtsQ/DivIB [Gammaproteobacteria bacterium]MDP6615578.1 cell division protein FtsQ/DivIB [Gammaproteobacteria bacterium]MDP6694748.1 cell division protein FtsQ/DivIB [Gammaproteobacteria bacterium]MDP7041603.1 cell division protein FtsQ/DivIB [Gammaproteobacteria bacterium]